LPAHRRRNGLPRINASGRLGSAERAVELLLAEDASTARRLAGELDTLNRRRKEIEQAVIDGLYEAFDKDRPLGTDDIIDVLSQTIPLSTMMSEEIDGLLGVTGSQKLERGERLLEYGQQSDTLYLILDGRLSVKLVEKRRPSLSGGGF
jgi:CRP-like cAMP-binding protein